jgi:drug/metabolite transporter (DMT)-like permease
MLQFGFVVVLAKVAIRQDLTTFSTLAFRFGIAAILLAAVLAALGRPLVPAPGERIGMILVGTLGYGVEASFFFSAIRHGTAAAVTLLFFTYPVIVTVVTWSLGRGRPNRLTTASLVCAMLGAAIVVATGAGLSIESLGVVFALGSAVSYSAYLVGAEHVLRQTNALTGAMWLAAAAGLGLGVFALATGQFEVPDGPAEWWPIIGMAVATAGAFVCLLGGLQRLGAVRTAIVSAAEPLAAAVLAYVFLGESVGVGIAIGGALIVVGAVAASLARAAPRGVEPPVP